MDRGNLTITVRANIDKTIDKLQDIGGCFSELYDLIPEHNRYEADKISEELWEHVNSLIETK